MTRVVKIILCIVCLMQAACATKPGLGEEFERSSKAYNRLLRWRELENAVITYADSGQRDEYLKRAENLKKQGLSITDFRILSLSYIAEKQSGDVVAEFDYYILPSNRIKTISHHQAWVYRENLKSWKLKNGLPDFE